MLVFVAWATVKYSVYLSFLFLFVYVEIPHQTGSQHHTRLDGSSEPSVQPASHRLPRPWERDRAGEAAAAPEAGDRGLEPPVLDQAEHHLQQG